MLARLLWEDLKAECNIMTVGVLVDTSGAQSNQWLGLTGSLFTSANPSPRTFFLRPKVRHGPAAAKGLQLNHWLFSLFNEILAAFISRLAIYGVHSWLHTLPYLSFLLMGLDGTNGKEGVKNTPAKPLSTEVDSQLPCPILENSLDLLLYFLQYSSSERRILAHFTTGVLEDSPVACLETWRKVGP